MKTAYLATRRTTLCPPTSIALLLLGVLCPAVSAEQVEPQPARPTLYLIGDSTVRCGQGNGEGGMYGWGQVLAALFDTSRIDVSNRAIGGRSSRTFLTEGRWQQVRDQLRPGDFVLMQFGHNDGGQMFEGNRPRASIKGNGDETAEGVVEQTGQQEVVHSYGWYLRKYCTEAKEHGATPIVLSLIPRDIWKNDKVIRAHGDYGRWAAEAAEQTGAEFVDLNEIVANHYEQDGQTKVHAEYFTPQDHTHTSLSGAKVNAACVVEGIRGLADCSLKDYLLPPEQVPADDQQETTRWRFDFGPGQVARGYYPVRSDSAYSDAQCYGFEPPLNLHGSEEGTDPVNGDCCSSDEPFYFSVAVPEGNYLVEAATPHASPDRPVTIKAELRRLMVERSAAMTHTFVVNVRQPKLHNGNRVALKDREKTKEYRAWDGKLTLEFDGPQPAVSSLTIQPADDVTTVFLAGDSTVTDQPLEPWSSWGQMLPRFFQPSVAVANHAESGETVRGSLGARRFDKIFDVAKPGDYLFVQFGHNDMKNKDADALDQYRQNLAGVVERARQQGMHPVLVTSMERKGGIDTDTLGDYPQAVRQLARELDVPLIDLHAASKQVYRALGDDLPRAFVDGTHHSSYGGYQLARCLVAGIRSELPELAKHLADDAPAANTLDVMPFSDWRLPESPQRDPAVAEPQGS